MRLGRGTVHTVTDARRPMSEDIRYRQRRYVVHMTIRTICLIMAVAVPMPLALRLVVVAAAIFLPYVAVVLANGGREPERRATFDERSRERRPGGELAVRPHDVRHRV